MERSGTVHMVGITTTYILTGGSKDRLTNKTLKRSVHCDCDVVDGITLLVEVILPLVPLGLLFPSITGSLLYCWVLATSGYSYS